MRRVKLIAFMALTIATFGVSGAHAKPSEQECAQANYERVGGTNNQISGNLLDDVSEQRQSLKDAWQVWSRMDFWGCSPEVRRLGRYLQLAPSFGLQKLNAMERNRVWWQVEQYQEWRDDYNKHSTKFLELLEQES